MTGERYIPWPIDVQDQILQREGGGPANRQPANSRLTEHSGSSRRILVINATHGFHIRNLFDSGLIRSLARDFRVVAITNSADADWIRQDYDDLAEVRSVATSIQPLERMLEFIRKRIVIKPDRAFTISVFSEREKLERPIRHRIERVLNGILGRSRTIRELWLRIEALLVPGTEFDATLRELSPAVIVTANYGTEAGAIRLLRSARRLSIPSVAVVPSFDNLTSKGVIGARPATLVVWNETMRREALQLHDFNASQVTVCGGVQFDVYANPVSWPSAESVWQKLGLDPGKPTIVIGTITPAYFPYNIEIIELLAESISSGAIPQTCQVLVRLHPQVVDGGKFGDDLARYRALAAKHAFVALDVPATRPWPTMQPPARDDMSRLAAILSHAAAVVVPASTLALDAAAVDAPVIGVAFDGLASRTGKGSVERMFYFTHYRPITESGAIALARSPEELINAVCKAMDHRGERSEARQKLATDTLGPRDGGAIARVTTVIRQVAGNPR
jgi:hypothetical protein